MPTIASFYGITIMMYLFDKEHEPPHIHAYYGEYDAPFEISTGKILGKAVFPKNGKKLVKEFILKYQKELNEMWESEKYSKLPPIK